ncbi:glycoside hydrolase family 9 protein, partial [Piromyces sp. E2]
KDYARHLELNFLFYEAQRSGPLPATNRIPWRSDSGLDHGADVGVDLTGGYYDAGDNVKFNFPQAFSMTTLSWMGIEFAKGVKEAGQTEYLKDTVKWGCDYLLKCHQKGTDVFYMQVGDGDIDHQYWKAYEEIDYPTPAFFVNSTNPGSEVTGETAAAFAAASILFKDSDPEYSATLLENALEWYEFADKYQGDYSVSVPKVASYYKNWGGYKDEIAWAAIWLYRALGDETYLQKAISLVSDYELGETGIDWDSKYQGVVVLLAQLGVDEFVKKVENWVRDICTNGKFSPGGMYINKDSEWGSLRRATAMAASLVYYTKNLPEGSELREMAKKFAKSQADYVQGANPLGVDFIVGADASSPKSVHHRTASGAECMECEPTVNVHILYGALAGGPDEQDQWLDYRPDYQKNEVALDYNVCYAAVCAYLIEEGLNVADPIPAWENDYRLTKEETKDDSDEEVEVEEQVSVGQEEDSASDEE